MKYTVILSDEASEDIQAVFRYIAEEKGLPITARRWVDSVENAIKGLDYMPYRYPRYELQVSEVSELRKLVIERHLVLYTVNDAEHLVFVFRVISERQDAASILMKSN